MTTRPRSVRKRIVALAVAAAVFFTVAGVQALDYNDLKNLLANNVPENVILNLVQQDPNLAITVEEANELRRLGATESVVMSIPRLVAGSVIQPGGGNASAQAPVVTTSPGTVYYTEPSVIVQEPTYVVPSPTYVVPSYPYYNRGPSWSFSIGFGSGRDRWRPHGRPPHFRPGGGRPGGRPPHGGGHRPGGGRPGGGRPRPPR